MSTSKSRAFSLLETLIATALFLVLLTGLVVTLQRSLAASRQSAERLSASEISQVCQMLRADLAGGDELVLAGDLIQLKRFHPGISLATRVASTTPFGEQHQLRVEYRVEAQVLVRRVQDVNGTELSRQPLLATESLTVISQDPVKLQLKPLDKQPVLLEIWRAR